MDHLSRLWYQIIPPKRERRRRAGGSAEDGVHGEATAAPSWQQQQHEGPSELDPRQKEGESLKTKRIK